MEIQKILGEFTVELTAVVQEVLARNKVKKDSELAKSVKWEVKKDSLLMYVNEYYEAVSKGRRPLKSKIPIQAIISWIKEYNIRSSKYPTGRLAFMIQTAIYKNGIRGKHFLELVEKAAGDMVEIRVADTLEEEIADDLEDAFAVI